MERETNAILAAVGELYESVIDDAKWLPAMQTIHGLVGGHAAFHIIADPSTGAVARSEQVGVDPVANELYLQYYAGKEVRIPPALAHGVGKVVTEGPLLDRKTYEKSEIYRDLLLPYDIPHIMAVWLQRTSHACQAFIVEGGRRHGPFQEDALEKFSAVARHLIRAARIREALVMARRERDIRMEVLDRLPLGVVFVDGTGTLVAASAYAEQILRDGNGLRVRQARLHAELPEDDRRLQEGLFHSCSRKCQFASGCNARDSKAAADVSTRRGHRSDCASARADDYSAAGSHARRHRPRPGAACSRGGHPGGASPDGGRVPPRSIPCCGCIAPGERGPTPQIAPYLQDAAQVHLREDWLPKSG